MRRREALLLAALAAPAAARAQGQTPLARWKPTRPIRLIVPYAASGGTDLLARALAEGLRAGLPQPIVVEARAGGTGKVRALAVSTATRSPYLPDRPPVQVQGIADFDLSGWVALLGPRGLPDGVAARLLPAIQRAYAEPALQERLRAMGAEPDLRPGPALLEAMARGAHLAEAAAKGHVRPQQ